MKYDISDVDYEEPETMPQAMKVNNFNVLIRKKLDVELEMCEYAIAIMEGEETCVLNQ